MSIITVQIGQCGNQIGEKFFETLINDCQDPRAILNQSNRFRQQQPLQSETRQNELYVQECKRRFFTESSQQDKDLPLMPRAVLIDMESKVVNKLVSKENHGLKAGNYSFKFRESNTYTQKKGSGNNWLVNRFILSPKKLFFFLFWFKFYVQIYSV